jgi:hypothetical protein
MYRITERMATGERIGLIEGADANSTLYQGTNFFNMFLDGL